MTRRVYQSKLGIAPASPIPLVPHMKGQIRLPVGRGLLELVLAPILLNRDRPSGRSWADTSKEAFSMASGREKLAGMEARAVAELEKAYHHMSPAARQGGTDL
jgi:hypothetical protein